MSQHPEVNSLHPELSRTFFLLTLLVLMCLPSIPESQGSITRSWSSRVVTTKVGLARGFIFQPKGYAKVEIFLGLPFASPPIGSLRFQPPVSPSPWPGTKMNEKAERVCPQVLPFELEDGESGGNADGSPGSSSFSSVKVINETEALKKMPRGRLVQLSRLIPFLKNQSEDCLYLNIYVPLSVAEGKVDRPMPVLVFIPGDDNAYGAGYPYDPSMLVSQGNIIVITFNFRLGILGFLNANSDGYFKSPANFALLDQIAALHWVQENIRAFGGDATNVTLMGHGKGAVYVNFLMISNALPSELLFHRVILMSGSALSPLTVGLSNGKDLAKKFSNRFKCPIEPPSNMLQCLRQLPLQYFLDSELWRFFGPSDDGIVIEHGIRENVLRDKISRYPMIFGVTKSEFLPSLSEHDATYGLEIERRREVLKQFIDGFYSFKRNEILAAVMHEYTDWERTIQVIMGRRKRIASETSDEDGGAENFKEAGNLSFEEKEDAPGRKRSRKQRSTFPKKNNVEYEDGGQNQSQSVSENRKGSKKSETTRAPNKPTYIQSLKKRMKSKEKAVAEDAERKYKRRLEKNRVYQKNYNENKPTYTQSLKKRMKSKDTAVAEDAERKYKHMLDNKKNYTEKQKMEDGVEKTREKNRIKTSAQREKLKNESKSEDPKVCKKAEEKIETIRAKDRKRESKLNEFKKELKSEDPKVVEKAENEIEKIRAKERNRILVKRENLETESKSPNLELAQKAKNQLNRMQKRKINKIKQMRARRRKLIEDAASEDFEVAKKAKNELDRLRAKKKYLRACLRKRAAAHQRELIIKQSTRIGITTNKLLKFLDLDQDYSFLKTAVSVENYLKHINLLTIIKNYPQLVSDAYIRKLKKYRVYVVTAVKWPETSNIKMSAQEVETVIREFAKNGNRSIYVYVGINSRGKTANPYHRTSKHSTVNKYLRNGYRVFESWFLDCNQVNLDLTSSKAEKLRQDVMINDAFMKRTEAFMIHPISVRDETLDALTDAQIVAPMVKVGELHSQGNSRTYFYVFEYQSKISDYAQRLGCVPGEDLMYVFGVPLYLAGVAEHQVEPDWDEDTNTKKIQIGGASASSNFGNFGTNDHSAGSNTNLGFFAGNFTRNEVLLSQALVHLWANFIRTGNPNNEPSPLGQSEGSPTGGFSPGASGPGIESPGTQNRFPQDKSSFKPIRIEWASYDTLFKKYLSIDARPRIRNHYRAHKLSFWLHLVPELMKTGGGGGGSIPNQNRPDSHHYPNIINSSNSSGPHPPSIQLVGPPYWEQHPFYFSGNYSSYPGGDISGPLGSRPNHRLHHQYHENEGFQIYSTALSVTIAVGCSLLILNILVFAACYYYRDKRRTNRQSCVNPQESHQQHQLLNPHVPGPLSASSEGHHHQPHHDTFSPIDLQLHHQGIPGQVDSTRQLSCSAETMVLPSIHNTPMRLKENGQVLNVLQQQHQHQQHQQYQHQQSAPMLPMPNICGDLPISNLQQLISDSGRNPPTQQQSNIPLAPGSLQSSTLPSNKRQRNSLQNFELSMPDAILAAAMMLNYRQNNSSQQQGGTDFFFGGHKSSSTGKRPALNMKEQLLLSAGISSSSAATSVSGFNTSGSGTPSNRPGVVVGNLPQRSSATMGNPHGGSGGVGNGSSNTNVCPSNVIQFDFDNGSKTVPRPPKRHIPTVKFSPDTFSSVDGSICSGSGNLNANVNNIPDSAYSSGATPLVSLSSSADTNPLNSSHSSVHIQQQQQQQPQTQLKSSLKKHSSYSTSGLSEELNV